MLTYEVKQTVLTNYVPIFVVETIKTTFEVALGG
jgi:hypothetical protein